VKMPLKRTRLVSEATYADIPTLTDVITVKVGVGTGYLVCL